MFDDLDVVRVKRAIPSAGIASGAEGTIVHVFPDPNRAFLVEFVDPEGRTLATEVIQSEDLERVWSVKQHQDAACRAA